MPIYRGWENVKCPACGQVGHHIDHHGCDHTAMHINITDYKQKHKQDLDNESVLEKFNKYQEQVCQRKLSSKKKRNLLRKKLRAAKIELENDDNKYREIKAFYIKSFKSDHQDHDLNDPRQDNTMDIKEYDILESEPESDSEE